MYPAVCEVITHEGFYLNIVLDTIEWNEGVDLDPEFIYTKSTPK